MGKQVERWGDTSDPLNNGWSLPVETDVSQVLELSQEVLLNCWLLTENQVTVKLRIFFGQALW